MNLTAEMLSIIVTEENGIIRLPKTGTNTEMRKKLGIEVLEESETWYYIVKLPTGWNVVFIQDIYDGECFIVDEKNRKRIRIVVELRANGSVLAASTQVYSRFYAILETHEKGRTVYLKDHMIPEFRMPICTCRRPYDGSEDSSSCIYSSLSELERSYPKCNDISIWDKNPLEKLEGYQEEYHIKFHCKGCRN